jgi:hypothetical protein
MATGCESKPYAALAPLQAMLGGPRRSIVSDTHMAIERLDGTASARTGKIEARRTQPESWKISDKRRTFAAGGTVDAKLQLILSIRRRRRKVAIVPDSSQQSRRERTATRSGRGQLEIGARTPCHSIDFCFSYPDVGSDVAPRYDAGVPPRRQWPWPHQFGQILATEKASSSDVASSSCRSRQDPFRYRPAQIDVIHRR